MTLTKEDIRVLGDLLDQKLEEKLDQKLEEKLEEKLEQKFDSKLAPVMVRLDALESGQREIRKELADVKEEQKVMKADIADIKKEQKVMKADIADIKKEQKVMKADIVSIKEEQCQMKEDITGIKVMIESELERNISIIAEGHGDIMRRMDEMQTEFQKLELLPVRLNVVEGEVRRMVKPKGKRQQLKEG